MDGAHARPHAAAIGIGLRAPHYSAIAACRPAIDLLEVHSENFFGAGGPALAWLERLGREHALSFHGVGLSLGSVDPLDGRHLAKLGALIDRFQPALLTESGSERVASSAVSGSIDEYPMLRQPPGRISVPSNPA